MVRSALLWAWLGLSAGCAASPGMSVVAPGSAGTGAVSGKNVASADSAASPSSSSDVPDRDPAARGRLAVDMSAADLPDDRDGDGVDQLDLCPELPPDRVDGCR